MKNIHLIPTDKPSRLTIRFKTNELMYSYKGFANHKYEDISLNQNQHIYITSDEEIKDGDKDFYIIGNDRDKTWINGIEKVIECKIDPKHGKVLILSSGFIYIDEGFKIILTTDPTLIADGVQSIDDTFLEWFVKNPSCEEVEVEPDYDEIRGDYYRIVILQEKPKALTKLEIAKNIAAIGIGKEKPKQETLEETLNSEIKLVHDVVRNKDFDLGFQTGGIFGAKWQAKKSYNEAIEFAEWIRIKDFQTTSKNNWIGLDMKYYTTQELFEKFKKK